MNDQNFLKSAVDILATNPPPDEPLRERTRSGKMKFWNAAEANARMFALEQALGIPHRTPIFNLFKANSRIEQLEEMLSVKGVAAPAATTATSQISAVAIASVGSTGALPMPAAAAGLQLLDGKPVASFVDFMKMPPAAREQFSSDRGSISRADFDKLSPAAQSAHCRRGGRIHDVDSSGNPASNFGNRSKMSGKEFFALSQAAQAALLKSGNLVIV